MVQYRHLDHTGSIRVNFCTKGRDVEQLEGKSNTLPIYSSTKDDVWHILIIFLRHKHSKLLYIGRFLHNIEKLNDILSKVFVFNAQTIQTKGLNLIVDHLFYFSSTSASHILILISAVKVLKICIVMVHI